jgi:hypothetical protein
MLTIQSNPHENDALQICEVEFFGRIWTTSMILVYQILGRHFNAFNCMLWSKFFIH